MSKALKSNSNGNKAITEQQLQDLQNEFQSATNIRRELIKIPRLKLGNALSESVQAGYAKSGEFSLNINNMNLGTAITIIPLITYENASLMNQAGQVVCSTRDLVTSEEGNPCATCIHDEYWNNWGTKEDRKVPKCKLSINIIAIFMVEGESSINTDNIAEINFRKNNYKAGKALVNFIVHDKSRLPFGTKYTLSSMTETNMNKQTYHIIDPNKVELNPCTQEEINQIIPTARKILQFRKANNIAVTEDTSPDSNTPI
jgi:hypothetical protein